MVGAGSLVTGQSGSPFVDSEVDNSSFGLLSVFGVPGPFTFRLQRKTTTVSNMSQAESKGKSAE